MNRASLKVNVISDKIDAYKVTADRKNKEII